LGFPVLLAVFFVVFFFFFSAIVPLPRVANEFAKRVFIDRVAFADVDRAPHLSVEACVEKSRRIVKRCALREGELDLVPVTLAGADDAIAGPGGYAERVGGLAPFHFLDDAGRRRGNDFADLAKRLRAPVAEFRDPRVDEAGCGFAFAHDAVPRRPK